jgi:hypothetical protein
MTRLLCLALLLSLAGAAGAQVSDRATEELRAEMVFWESVRGSTDPGDFRAYLEQYPNGKFAPLARNRLAALTPRPPVGAPAAAPAQASPQPSAQPAQTRASGSRLPSEGDTWTYRLKEPKRVDGPTERNYIVKVFAASAAGISEEYAIEGEVSGQWTHKSAPDVVPVGRPVLAPYLLAFGDLPPGGALGRVQVAEGACGSTYQCQASGRIVSWEKIKVPAGTFDTVRVEVDQNWRSVAMSGAQGAQAYGARKITVWYSAAAKRAVKFSSRATMGHFAPIETDFELELSSYQLK